MMKDAHGQEYAVGMKNNWRRQVWAEIRRRTNMRKDRIVTYLAGPDDLDRKHAIAAGFRPDNLVIVDRDVDTVRHHRRNGKLAIRGDFFDIMSVWPASAPVSVILADTCSIVDDSAYNLIIRTMFCSSFSAGGVVVMNFQRGRDPVFNKLILSRMKNTPEHERNKVIKYEKHRGMHLLCEAINEIGGMLELCNVPEFGGMTHQCLCDMVAKAIRPRAMSYKKSRRGVVMDTIIYSIPNVKYYERAEAYNQSCCGYRPYIAATMATRTKRIAGVL